MPKWTLRDYLGFVVFVILACPYLIAAIQCQLMVCIMAACEATVGWLWDREPWLAAYKEERRTQRLPWPCEQIDESELP